MKVYILISTVYDCVVEGVYASSELAETMAKKLELDDDYYYIVEEYVEYVTD